jgi:hypothetical protein
MFAVSSPASTREPEPPPLEPSPHAEHSHAEHSHALPRVVPHALFFKNSLIEMCGILSGLTPKTKFQIEQAFI